VIYLAWGALLFHFPIHEANWLGAIVILVVVSILAFAGLGVKIPSQQKMDTVVSRVLRQGQDSQLMASGPGPDTALAGISAVTRSGLTTVVLRPMPFH
jgi:hypothetical protein